MPFPPRHRGLTFNFGCEAVLVLSRGVLFGREDILINNIAWMLRRLPVFGVFGDGMYRLQPIYVDDLAELAVEQGRAGADCVIDAIGPETFTYRELVAQVRTAIGSSSIVLPMPSLVVLAVARLLGVLVRDVVLTHDEIRELTSSLLTSYEPARGEIRLSEWLPANAEKLGRHWSSELDRNYRGFAAS